MRLCPLSKSSIRVWGPSAWNLLHVVAFQYSETPSDEERRRAYNFLVAFSGTLPCETCRVHFTRMIARHIREGRDSAVFASRDAFARATVEWHNVVNERLHKPRLPFDLVAMQYSTDPKARRCYALMGMKVSSAVAATLVVVVLWRLSASRRTNREGL